MGTLASDDIDAGAAVGVGVGTQFAAGGGEFIGGFEISARLGARLSVDSEFCAPGGTGTSIPSTIGVVSATTAGAGGVTGGGVNGIDGGIVGGVDGGVGNDGGGRYGSRSPRPVDPFAGEASMGLQYPMTRGLVEDEVKNAPQNTQR